MLEANYVDLDELLALPRNPKLHALDDIGDSVKRWGFVKRVIVNQQTRHIIAGNGRCDELQRWRKRGEVPENIQVQAGAWLVPVDYVDVPEGEELQLAIALNNLQEKGGWDHEILTGILKEEMQSGKGLVGTGFDEQQIAWMLGMEDTPISLPPESQSLPDLAEYVEPEASQRIIIQFEDYEQLEAFVELVGLPYKEGKVRYNWNDCEVA